MTPAPPNEDIVARARWIAKQSTRTSMEQDVALADCADEIERLRAENEKVKAEVIRWQEKWNAALNEQLPTNLDLAKLTVERSLLLAVVEAAEEYDELFNHEAQGDWEGRCERRYQRLLDSVKAYRSAYPSQGEGER